MTLTQAVLSVALTCAAGIFSLVILAVWLGRCAGAHPRTSGAASGPDLKAPSTKLVG